MKGWALRCRDMREFKEELVRQLTEEVVHSIHQAASLEGAYPGRK